MPALSLACLLALLHTRPIIVDTESSTIYDQHSMDYHWIVESAKKSLQHLTTLNRSATRPLPCLRQITGDNNEQLNCITSPTPHTRILLKAISFHFKQIMSDIVCDISYGKNGCREHYCIVIDFISQNMHMMSLVPNLLLLTFRSWTPVMNLSLIYSLTLNHSRGL